MIRLLALILALVPLPLAAQDLAGRWTMRAEGRVLMALTVERAGGWRARIERLHGQVDGGSARDLHGPAFTTTLRVLAATADTLTLADGTAVVFVLHRLSGDEAEWRLRDVADFPPQLFRRNAAAGPRPADFVRSRTYRLDADWPDSAAMTALFDADQADRAAGPAIDWAIVWPRDRQRRAAAQALVDAEALHSGDDYYHAAFVFQHGEEPGDFLRAHALAVIAAARGRADATWIAGATLDRYLQRIGRPQVYGTQFLTPPGGSTTQEPYDRTALSDGLRRASGVPSLAEQAAQRARWDRQYGTGKR